MPFDICIQHLPTTSENNGVESLFSSVTTINENVTKTSRLFEPMISEHED